jgi:hypothetical protein
MTSYIATMHLLPATAIATLLLASSHLAKATELYRYVNSEGNTVIDYRVPPEYAANGYEVINEDGVVLRVVPRALSDAERDAWSDEQKRAVAEREEAERLRKWDESLLLRYSSVADIEDARDRALRDLRIRLSILRGNRRSLRAQVESYQAQAADQERMGLEASVELEQAIEELQRQIASGDRSIEDREQEIEEVAAAYKRDIGRFEQLQEIVEMRRAAQRP